MMSFEEFFRDHCKGEVSFLKDHIEIARLVHQRGIECNSHLTLDSLKNTKYHGFDWSATIEEHDFWSDVMNGNVDTFYHKYPKANPNEVD